MRNRSKRFHLPSQEWSKIVRFNSQDYLMRSVYDKDQDIEGDANLKSEIDTDNPIAPTGTVLDELPINKALMKCRRPRKVNEDFMDDMEEFGFDTQEEVEQEVQKIVDAEVASQLTYIFTDIDGNQKELQMSPDNFRNVIMFLLQGVIAFHPQDTATSVDKYVYASGRMNNLFAYRMNVFDIKCVGGVPKFIISQTDDSNRRGGYINVHFTEERDAVISISFPGVGYKRPFSLVSMSYEDFCEFLPYDRITGKVKPIELYYEHLLTTVLDKIRIAGSGVTLMENLNDDGGLKRIIAGGRQVNRGTLNAEFLKQNFRPLQKFSQKSMGDMNVLKDAIDYEMSQIENIVRNDVKERITEAKYYVMIGGSETLFDRLRESKWGGSYGCALPDSQCLYVQLFTQDPQVSTKRIEHNLILLPLSVFISRLPALWLWFMC